MIENISLNSFRGATKSKDFKFNTKKKITLVYGENGCGKSTVVDAIDVVFNNNAGSVKYISGFTNKMLASLGKSPADIKVLIKENGSEFSTTVGNSSLSSNPSNPTSAIKPKVNILRKYQLLDLVTAAPADRYQTIKKFIDIDVIRHNEENLRKCGKTFEANKKLSEDKNVRARVLLEEKFKATQVQGDWEAWAKSIIAESIEDKNKYHKSLSVFISSLDNLVETKKSINAISEEIKTKKETLDSTEKNLSEAGNLEDLQMLEVLEQSKHFLKENLKTKNCPVCQKEIDGNASILLEKINGRLTKMGAIKQARDKRTNAKKEYVISEEHLRRSIQNFLKNVATMAEKCKIAKNIKQIISLGIDWDLYVFSAEAILASTTETLNSGMDIVAKLETIKKPLLDEFEALSKELQEYNTIKSTYKEYFNSLEDYNRLSKLLDKQKALLDIVESKRKKYENDILNSIQTEVNAFFKKIHPNENIEFKKFEIDENKKGSIHLDSSFHGKEGENCHCYFSESHLDTLGICIWLALAKKDGVKLIVLDDIFTSVDAQHVDRLLDLLEELAYDNSFKQIILTSHFNRVREKYKTRGSGKFDIIDLRSWDINSGILSFQNDTLLGDLKKEYEDPNFNRINLANLAGLQLDNILQIFAHRYNFNMPINGIEKGYTLYDYYLGFKKEIKQNLAITEQQQKTSEKIAPLLEAIFSSMWIRNKVGAHLNPDTNVSDKDIKDFAEKVIMLSEKIFCLDCETYPNYKNKVSGKLTCSCGKKSLEPVEN